MQKLFVLIIISWQSVEVKAQATVITSTSATQLAEYLTGKGVTVSNASLNCPTDAAGFFNGVNANFGMDSGIILTSGKIISLQGPNINSSTGFNNSGSGYTPLDDYLLLLNPGSVYKTQNACILEFDVNSSADTLVFEYVFASEEYPEFANSNYNDIFAFFISGPGIAGSQNIALIPGTTTPVTINTVNCQNNSPYYLCNDPNNSFCSIAYTCPSNANATTFGYDGYTTVLRASQGVELCKTYHLKLAIADVFDPNYDSAVMIKAGSLRSTGVKISEQSIYSDPDLNFPAAVEGCVDGQIIFKLNRPATNKIANHFIIKGTAVNGTDYSHVPDSVVFLPGDSMVSVTIHSIQDNVKEGLESVMFISLSLCTGLPLDTVLLYIDDAVNLKLSKDTSVCLGNAVPLQLISSPFYTYNWSPPGDLSCSTCSSTVASPTVTTKYYVDVTLQTCIVRDSVLVTVVDIAPDAGPDVQICKGGSTQLQASGGVNYLWSPAAGLSNASISNPVANPAVATTYTVTVSFSIGCDKQDFVAVDIFPEFIGTAGTNTTICEGGTAELTAGGGTVYTWTPISGLSNPNSSFTFATPLTPTTYLAIITNAEGCNDTIPVKVDFFSSSSVIVSPEQKIRDGESVEISASGGISYQWSPNSFINTTDAATPVVNPSVSTTYTVTIITDEGCEYVRFVHVIVKTFTEIFAPNAFSPNGDGNNDFFIYIARGIFKLESFKVFNRWGEVIFKTDTPGIGWNGTWNGQPMGVGSYVYEISGSDSDNKTTVYKGNFTLIR